MPFLHFKRHGTPFNALTSRKRRTSFPCLIPKDKERSNVINLQSSGT